MRRMIALLIWLLTLSAACYGAEDVYMQNITSKLDMILKEQKAQRYEIDKLTKAVAVLSERVDRNFNTLSSRMDRLNTSLPAQFDRINARIDFLHNGIYVWLVLIGIFIALIVVKTARLISEDFIQTESSDSKSPTLEDVMRLIEENNAKLNISSQKQ